MPKYIVKVVDKKGGESTREVEGLSEEVARLKIREEGLYVMSISTIADKKRGSAKALYLNVKKMPLFQVRTTSRKDVFMFTRKLATLLDAGLPLLRSLKVLKEQKKVAAMGYIVGRMEMDISSGEMLSQSMSCYPATFNRLYISMVRAGEIGGVLSIVLERLAEFFEQAHWFRKRVTHAMFYPAMILMAAVFVVFVLLLFVIPKFQLLFSELKVELPYATRLLLMSSYLVKNYFLWIVGGFIGLVIVIRLAMRLSWVLYVWDGVCLKIPFWGDFLENIEVVRFSRLMGTLLQSGVPILQAFDISKTAATNQVFVCAIESVQVQVREGSSVSESMETIKAFPQIMVNMVDVGEESGQLDKMFLKVANLYEEDVKNMIETMTKLIEPALIVFLALLVGFIVVAMFLPLVSMMNALGQ